MKRKYFWIGLISFITIVNVAFSTAGGFRIILPTLAELSLGGFSISEGELMFDSDKKVITYHDGTRLLDLPVDFNVDMPTIRMNHVSQLNVSAGKVFINGRLYKNSSPIVCDVATSGLGGLESGSASPFTYYSLYLIPDPTSGYEENFNCVLSDSHSGPLESAYTDAWKRVVTFRYFYVFYYSFTSKNGLTHFFGSGVPISIPASTPATCDAKSVSAMMPVNGLATFQFDSCTGALTSLYSESSCSTMPATSCTDVSRREFQIESTSSPFVFYATNYGSSDAININLIEFEQEIIESTY